MWSGQGLIGHTKNEMESIMVSSGLISLSAFNIMIIMRFVFPYSKLDITYGMEGVVIVIL